VSWLLIKLAGYSKIFITDFSIASRVHWDIVNDQHLYSCNKDV